MNRQDVAKLLAYAAANDARTVGESDLHAWFDILGPLDFDRCLAAARKHYREQPDTRLKPGHLWRLAKATTGPTPVDECDQGVYCPKCTLYHQPTEACEVNTHDPAMIARALETFRGLDAPAAS